MPEENETPWLEVIAKALAYLCLQQVSQIEPKRASNVIAKVKFLKGLGISTSDAAQILGTTANSVKTNQRQREKKGGGTGGKNKR